jgi:hypothetical protein
MDQVDKCVTPKAFYINVVVSFPEFPSVGSVPSKSPSILITVFEMGTDVSCSLWPTTKIYFIIFEY